MRIILSRKGFDSAAGGVPSPILDGVPISLPIPTEQRSHTTYGSIGLGEIVARATKGRLGAKHLCHEDPMFDRDQCAFGQTGAAQSHLARHGVSVGDMFLFFGLFANEDGLDRHHRIFGYLHVEEIRHIGRQPSEADQPARFPRRHPHTIGAWNDNNSIYIGRGKNAKFAHAKLRLSKPNGPVSSWLVPAWLSKVGLTYHGATERWTGRNELRVVARGQEFIADVGNRDEPRRWLAEIVQTIERPRI